MNEFCRLPLAITNAAYPFLLKPDFFSKFLLKLSNQSSLDDTGWKIIMIKKIWILVYE